MLDGINHSLRYCYQHKGMDSHQYNIKFLCRFANHMQLLGSTSVTAVSNPEWQRIPADYIATVPCSGGRIMLHHPQLLADTKYMEHKYVFINLSKIWASHKNSSLKGNKQILEHPQTSGATVQYLVATATWRPGFVHPYIKISLKVHLHVCEDGVLQRRQVCRVMQRITFSKTLPSKYLTSRSYFVVNK